MGECLSRKRKGKGALTNSEVIGITHIAHNTSSFAREPCFSSGEDLRTKKKYKEQTSTEAAGSCTSNLACFISAPIYRGSRSLASYPPGRGLKRKLGCINSATQMGRKKKIDQDYILGPEIGQGRFGRVRLCWSKVNGEEFACKTLMKNGEEPVHREVEIMQHLSGHPSVVTLKAVYEDTDSFHLVMELCPGGRLLDCMAKQGSFSEKQAAVLLKELILVIRYCHEMGVVHRDIKPENILLTVSGRMKLADFGLAMRVSTGQTLSGVAGSPAYVAPEVLVGDYSEKVDIWSAGILLHGLLVGFLPFQGDSLEAVFEAIKTAKLDFEHGVWESVSGPARDLLGRMLTRDVNTRITTGEVLCHPWILFYTDDVLKPQQFKSKAKRHGAVCRSQGPFHAIAVKGSPLSRSYAEPINGTNGVCLSASLEHDVQDDGDCGLVDALAAAISRVRISEPKRSRVCGPTFPVQYECSSNMKTNLCTAF